MPSSLASNFSTSTLGPGLGVLDRLELAGFGAVGHDGGGLDHIAGGKLLRREVLGQVVQNQSEPLVHTPRPLPLGRETAVRIPPASIAVKRGAWPLIYSFPRSSSSESSKAPISAFSGM